MHRSHPGRARPRRAAVLVTALGLAVLTGCGGGSDDASGGEGDEVVLVTHDSFEIPQEVLDTFTEETGYRVRTLRGGDAGVVVNQAVLSAGNPQGDVLFGVDNTLLSRALDAGVFTPHESAGLASVPEEYQLDAGQHRVTPIDTGDICVNYDRGYFAEHDLAPPETLDELVDPAYRDLLVVENAATSSPGLGFLLATVDAYGEDGWQEYWQRLAENGVEVVDGWEQAYYERFSGAGGSSGDRPLVVSYASSPPAEVAFGGESEELPAEAPTGVSTGTCFRQIEFAGLLDGAAHPEGGRALLDFLLTDTFQRELPMSMFVNPVVETELPEVFTRYGVTVDEPWSVEPAAIAEHREEWVDAWTSLVVR
ncbi:thiamine ABC transporter substrate-binding protein [Streptomyces hainanensis]|uniref:Thiamine ABC transporter substrate-binding protein n=1 Tax=Streptomyces hainanensis TaxID=402648 RepID=A0A4R4TDQ4_9ACTN|nr:thiamine ABC transporter substrate-binding protein [Streptomyces hainanensis]TDC75621.1 thiamine ABC transporter substrate-binding protein [Streptomyces hainanensis]